MKNCDTYIFDLYGTLIDIRTNEKSRRFWQAISRYLASQGLYCHAGRLETDYLTSCRQESSLMAASHPDTLIEIDIANVFRTLYASHGINADDQMIVSTARAFRLLSLEKLQLYPKALEVLGEMRLSGKRVYLLSNAQKLFTEMEIDSLNLRSCFDGILYSSEAGVRKPDARFFRLLLDRFDIDPARAIMIGNDYHDDILGAYQAGIASIYIPTAQSSRRNGALPENCRSIRKLSDLLSSDKDY